MRIMTTMLFFVEAVYEVFMKAFDSQKRCILYYVFFSLFCWLFSLAVYPQSHEDIFYFLKCIHKIFMLAQAFFSSTFDYQRHVYAVNVNTRGMNILLPYLCVSVKGDRNRTVGLRKRVVVCGKWQR